MINIEIDGIPLTVDPSKMIIQVADEAGIDIPRFCYHKKLSIAANCRMCLVEVEKSNKALPACATPVSEGMKIFTASATAKAAQRGVMEFLLINHPLDCPICDQGGECELQDLSMGYGAGVGRFSESKRVVKDKNIGALVKTDMTRCIHCTRCVRFGQEIAGIKELGATGRGEHMEIGTYIEQSLGSELSGNIIDLCPVGALTSKPFRYKARAWELSAHASIAPHDAIGSNIEIHTRRDEVMRVVPRDNESLNETWLSDRDRFSYLGLTHEERATTPMVKQNGQWQKVDWQTALNTAVTGIKAIIEQSGAGQVAGLASPTASLEEAYLLQKLLSELGVNNLDHRVRQQDFSDDAVNYDLDVALSDIEASDTVLIVGSAIRREQPILAHRIRQAALSGTRVNELNFFENDLLMPVDTQLALNIESMLDHLSGIAKALFPLAKTDESAWTKVLSGVVPEAADQTIAMQLSNADKATIIVGDLAKNHPDASKIKAVLALIARLSGSILLVLPTANSKAAQLVGLLPKTENGLNAQQSFQADLKSYVLLGLEPELDSADPVQALSALNNADCVVAMHSYVTEAMLSYADVILPVSSFAESSGTFVGIDGQWQNYTGAISPKGESRPAWKVLRVLANLADLDGFQYVSSQDVSDEVREKLKQRSLQQNIPYCPVNMGVTSTGIQMISEVPMYQVDSVVRRSTALAQTVENQNAFVARMNASEAEQYGLSTSDRITVSCGERAVELAFEIDGALADACVHMPIGITEMAEFGPAFSTVEVKAVGSKSS
ncbi:MAG: NADH-quinone oxidoreductase subunit G [Piscirickettsiaceae bacterium]|jgi:NADH-quinone oxidoreductase subunit G|nr:NADH-quinone oxidoreductase subunit G [Piscirickettsiaceae bacterium]